MVSKAQYLSTERFWHYYLGGSIQRCLGHLYTTVDNVKLKFGWPTLRPDFLQHILLARLIAKYFLTSLLCNDVSEVVSIGLVSPLCVNMTLTGSFHSSVASVVRIGKSLLSDK